MSKATAGQIITEARDALNDANGVRWTNAKLYRYIFAAEQFISGNHPECQYDGKVENPAPVLLTNLTDETTIAITHYPAVVAYVVSRCFAEDSDDNGSTRQAQYWMNECKAFLGDVQVR